MSKTALVGWMLGVSLMVVSGQLLLKYHFVRFPLPSPLTLALVGQAALTALGDPWFWLSGLCVLGSALMWMFVLNKAPLSRAYPMAGFVFVLMLLAGAMFFHEPVTWRKALGIAGICAGIALL